MERFLAAEALSILKVSEKADKAPLYRFHLVNFPRKDILGFSMGNHQIFVSYELCRLAYEKESFRWLFRQTLAHEIAHETLGGEMGKHRHLLSFAPGLANSITGEDLGLDRRVFFRHYSQFAELEADKKGLEYWKKIGWDCQIWVRIFQDFLKQGYRGDVDHPTEARLNQAVKACPPNSVEKAMTN